MIKNSENGRSMIEMLGVLAIIGVLSVGGIMGYSKAMMRYKINKWIESVTIAAANIKTTFASQGNYEGVDNVDIWKKAHIFPDEMCREENGNYGCYNPLSTGYDDAVEIYSSGRYFSIRMWDFPLEACIEIASYDWRNAGAVLIDIEEYDNYRFKPPVKLEDAMRACEDGYEDPNTTYAIEIYFGEYDPEWDAWIADTRANLDSQ